MSTPERSNTKFSRSPLGAVIYAELPRFGFRQTDISFRHFCCEYGLNTNALQRVMLGQPKRKDDPERLLRELAGKLKIDAAPLLDLLRPEAAVNALVTDQAFPHLAGNRPMPRGMTFKEKLAYSPRRVVTLGQLAVALRAERLFCARGFPGTDPDPLIIDAWPDSIRAAWARLAKLDGKLKKRGFRVPASWAVWRLIIENEQPTFQISLHDPLVARHELLALRLGLRVLARD